MSRTVCPKCNKEETILKSGFVRGLQRYFCKECIYHFTLLKGKKEVPPEGKKKHQTTLLDISKAVGLSISTVSRALKDHDDISKKTRLLIKQIATDLDYQPNLIAQSLHKRQTHTIGVIIPDIENPFFASVLSGIQHTASAYGYKVMIYQSNESHRTEIMNIQTIMNNWIDGLLICHSKETQTFDHIKLHMKKGIPIIHFDRICEETNTSKVLLDNVEGATQIVEHLIGQGCRRIAVIAGPKHLYITRKRLEGYKNALSRNAIDFEPQLIAYTDFTRRSIRQAIDAWLPIENRPDALFCISDNSAIHALVYLKEKGVKIPGEICVAGFGNDYTGEIIEPSLTSFNPNSFKVGEKAVDLFFDEIINGENFIPRTEIVKGNLIIRSSTQRKA
jgi:LacI family transcriptional regulator